MADAKREPWRINNMKEHSHQDKLSNAATKPSANDAQISLYRRRLLRRATASVPVIMTLNSGAALAFASGLLPELSTSKTVILNPARVFPGDDTSDLVCLDDPPSQVEPVVFGDHVKYEEPTGCILPEGQYVKEADGDDDGVDDGVGDDDEGVVVVGAVDVCIAETETEFTGSQVGEINGQNGLLLSAGAYSSIAPNLSLRDNCFL